MPVINRTLIKLGDRPDMGAGWAKWRIDGVDDRGRRWTHGPFGALQADAEAQVATCWPQSQIDDDEERQAVKAIVEGDDPETTPLYDLTRSQLRRRLARRFWRSNLRDDRDFLEKIAPYIAGFTAAQIAQSLGITEAKAQGGIDRAVKIRDILSANMADVDNGAEDLG